MIPEPNCFERAAGLASTEHRRGLQISTRRQALLCTQLEKCQGLLSSISGNPRGRVLRPAGRGAVHTGYTKPPGAKKLRWNPASPSRPFFRRSGRGAAPAGGRDRGFPVGGPSPAGQSHHGRRPRRYWGRNSGIAAAGRHSRHAWRANTLAAWSSFASPQASSLPR